MILLAPIYSLFSLSFYRKVLQFRVGKAFLYLFYLSFLATLLMLFISLAYLAPNVNGFVDWAKQNMPAMTWSPSTGLTVNAQQPYSMVHPQLGLLITFDTNAQEVNAAAMGEVPIFVTAKQIYVRQAPNQVKVYDITAPAGAAQAAASVNITPDLVQRFYDSLKPWLLFFLLLFFFVFFFIWKVLAALFYSWIGLLINFTRQPKLSYGALFTVSAFALTAGVIVQVLPAFIPFLAQIPFWGFLSIPVTIAYLFIVIKKTQGQA
jgi:hypothetical protein